MKPLERHQGLARLRERLARPAALPQDSRGRETYSDDVEMLFVAEMLLDRPGVETRGIAR